MKICKRMAVAAVVMLALTAFVAGCQGTTSDSGGQGTGDSGAASVSPEEPSMDVECPVCGMMPAKHSEWNAQIVFDDGEHVHFDVPTDALTYYFNPGEYFPEGKTKDDVAKVYFTDYYTTQNIPMNDELYFVKGSDVTGPMGKDLVPVQGMDEAESFAEDHGGEVHAASDVTPDMVSSLKGDMDMSGDMEMDDGSMEETSDALEVPTESECPVCGMMSAEYPEWNAQVVYEDGEGDFFCSPKDAWTFYFNPGEYSDRSKDEIKEVYFTEYNSGEFVAMNDLHFVNGSDADGPMGGKDIVPIKGMEAAQSFADEHGGTVYSADEVTSEMIKSLKGDMDMDMSDNSSMDMEG